MSVRARVVLVPEVHVPEAPVHDRDRVEKVKFDCKVIGCMMGDIIIAQCTHQNIMAEHGQSAMFAINALLLCRQFFLKSEISGVEFCYSSLLHV